MKKGNKIFLAVISIALFTLISCESKLDLRPSSELASQDALNSLSAIDVALTGSYAGMQSRYYYGRNFEGFAHMTSDDALIPGGAGSFAKLEPFYQMIYTPANGATLTWAQMYDVIGRVNNIINSIDGVEGPEAEKNRIKGEALFIRALVHHDLLRLFAQDYKYTADASHLGVPYITVSEISSPSRNTVAECYELILGDLAGAISLLGSGNERASIDTPNFGSVWAAKAVRARVHLYMGDYTNALLDANDVIDNGGFTLAPYKVDDGAGGVDLSQIDSWSSRVPNSESIFELEFDELDGLWGAKASFSGLFRPQPDGYGEAGPNMDIINMYSANDFRNNWFLQDGGQNFINKYPDNDGVRLNFTFPVVRLTEMYLIKAEAHAVLNQPNDAIGAVNSITVRANAPEIVLSAQLLSDILDERRRELAFEGHRFFDIKRLQLDIVRNDCNLQNNCTVAYGDKLYAYPIPQEEMDANPNMEQNTGY